MSNLLIPTLIRSLHNIFTSIWIGGMLFMILTLLPVIRRVIADKNIQGELITQVLICQSRWIYLGIFVLLISGLLLSRQSGQTKGFLDFENRYAAILSLKHILVIVIAIVAVIRSTLFREAATSKSQAKKKISMALLLINTLLGIAILVLSSMNAIIN